MDTPNPALVERVSALSAILAHKSALILFERLQEKLLELHIRLNDIATCTVPEHRSSVFDLEDVTQRIVDVNLQMVHVLAIIEDK